jgi:hypothetical protein
VIRNAYKSFLENLEGRGHLEYLGIDEMVEIKWAVKKWSWTL